MRTFPVKTPIGPVSKITPNFIGFNRGINPHELDIKPNKPTSQAQIKALRTPETNTIPIVNINDRYRHVTRNVNFTRDISTKAPNVFYYNPIGKRPNKKKSVTISTYNFE